MTGNSVQDPEKWALKNERYGDFVDFLGASRATGDDAVAACLWANDVGGRLGALVVVARRELRRGMPVLDLSRCTPADPPLTLMTQVLRFGREHADAARTGFLSWPVSG